MDGLSMRVSTFGLIAIGFLTGPTLAVPVTPNEESSSLRTLDDETSPSVIEPRAGPAGSYKSALYFPNWDIYGRNFLPQDLPIDRLTHILYAFANIRADTGEVYLSDTYADLDKHYPSDSWNDAGNNVYGCVKQLYLLKKKNRHMKVLLSIGGWTYSSNFARAVSTDSGRQTFASSAVQLLIDLGFDGLDIDWEYPQDSTQANNLVALLQAIRLTLDSYAATLPNNAHFLLTTACPAGPTNYQKLNIPAMDMFLDFWNLMAYDYAGSWDTTSGHQANLYASIDNPTSTPFCTDSAVKYYVGQGVNPRKLLLGQPLYGRSFEATAGPGMPYSGIGQGSWEVGVWDYKTLPKAGAEVHFDSVIGASWSYDPQTQEMISYDSPDMAAQKLQYIYVNNLGGSMWWEANGDKNTTRESLINITVSGFEKLDGIKNTLNYPDSKYDNIKAGMPGQ